MQQEQQPKVVANISLEPLSDGSAQVVLTSWSGLRVETIIIPAVQVEYFIEKRHVMFEALSSQDNQVPLER